jgi:hypothetical protein
MPWPRLSRSAVAALAGAVAAGLVIGSSHPAAGVPDLASGVRWASGVGTVDAAELRPVAPTIRRHRIATPDAQTSATEARSGPVVTLSPTYAVSGHATVGLTWDGAAGLGGTALRVRLLDGGTWSGWSLLEHEPDHAPDPGSVESVGTSDGTEPLLIGHVDRVQVQVTAARGAPPGLTLAVIDPGPSTDDLSLEGAPLAVSAGAPAPAAASTGVPQPAIYSRAQWGADESLRDGTPTFGTVETTFVHHTVNANDYSAAEVPAIMRSIYAYHTQVRGWSDIGYNVLVDRFGRLWEGRYGGLEQNVLGAHTLGYNEEAFGVSAIGNFEEVPPTTALLDALARVLAWKLDMAGLPAKGVTSVDGADLLMINGHRDAASTACPGTYLYEKLSVIRTKTQALIEAGGELPVVLGLERAADTDTRPDVVVRDDGALRSMLGDAGPGFLARTGPGSKAGRLDTVTGMGDLDGDGRGDVLVRNGSDGTFQVRSADGEGGLAVVTTIGGTRFRRATALVGAPDLTGDGLHDLIVRMPSGDVRVAAGEPGGFASSQLVSTDWGTHRAVLGAGDLDADGVGDLLLVDADGVLWTTRGLGDLTFAAPVRRSGGWDARRHFVAGPDLTGDGHPDLMATDVADGLTWIRPGTGSGGFGVPIGGWAAGWTGARIVAVTADATGDGFADAVVVDAEGRMSVRPSRHGMWLRPGSATEGDWAAYRWLRLVGDWNGDGRGDLAGVDGDVLWIFAGRGDGTFRARTGGWPGWSGTGQLAAVEDWNGDGRPDLISRPRDGSLWLHRGRGSEGTAAPVPLRAADPDLNVVLPVGLWNADGHPDLVARGPDGVLTLLPGLGSRLLGAPVPLTDDGLAGYDRLLGAGDLTGDGRPDLLARARRSGTAYILPGSLSGVGTSVRVAGGWGRYTMIG